MTKSGPERFKGLVPEHQTPDSRRALTDTERGLRARYAELTGQPVPDDFGRTAEYPDKRRKRGKIPGKMQQREEEEMKKKDS